MTYKECQEFIETNREKVERAISLSFPKHEIRILLITPENLMADNKMQKIFLERCFVNNESNEYVLSDAYITYFVSNKLKPFIILRHGIEYLTLGMEGYLEGLEANEEGKAS